MKKVNFVAVAVIASMFVAPAFANGFHWKAPVVTGIQTQSSGVVGLNAVKMNHHGSFAASGLAAGATQKQVGINGIPQSQVNGFNGFNAASVVNKNGFSSSVTVVNGFQAQNQGGFGFDPVGPR